jgi:hypothetical protein
MIIYLLLPEILDCKNDTFIKIINIVLKRNSGA